MKSFPDSKRYRILLMQVGALLTVCSAHAQATTPPTNSASSNPPTPPPTATSDTGAKPGGEEDMITLSPFQVDVSKDHGYYSANTLSGTRINSKVQDLGASITVVNKQQLVDTAALGINDVFRYEANTEGTFNYTSINSAAPTVDSLQGGAATSGGPNVGTRLRGISAPNIAMDNFTHTARIPFDTYNVGSLEISRGPNSTLFGLGSPSGTINSNLQTADLLHPSQDVEFRVDSFGGYRSSLNVSQPLISDKLAIRVAGLYWNNAYEQKPSYDLTKREYATLTYKPFKDTTLTLKAEHYRENRQSPNTLTPRDGVTEWLNNGKPTWDPLTQTYTVNGVTSAPIPVGSGATAELLVLPSGLYSNATTYTRPTMYISGGQVELWEITRLNTTINPVTSTSNVREISSGNAIMRGTINGGVLYNNIGISNKNLYDWTSVNATPMNWNYDSAAMYTVDFQQKIIENLYFRAGWHLEDSTEYNRNISSGAGSSAPTLLIDVNKNLVDGSANPYYLRPYIQTIEPSIFNLPEYNDTLQAQLTYELNLSEKKGFLHWLGHHRLLGYYESRHLTQGTFRFREAVTDPNHPWETAGALNYTNGSSAGRPTYQYYVGPSGAIGYTSGYNAPISGVQGTFNMRYFSPTTGTFINDPAQFGTAPYVSSQFRQEVTSRGGVLQSDFLDDRIVFTGGIRNDFNRQRNSGGNVVNAATGFYDNGPLSTWGAWSDAQGYTRSAGIVVKPLPWFGISYNKASSFLPQPPAVDLNNNVLPNTYGHGHDAGVFFNLLGDKLVISLKAYKQTNINDRTSDSTIGSRIARLEAGGAGVSAGAATTIMTLNSGSADTFSVWDFAQTVASQRLGAGATTDQINATALQIAQFPAKFLGAVNSNNAGTAIRGTANTEANGGELEITYNPTPNWTIKFSGAKTIAINNSIENDIAGYLAARLPFWQSLKDDQGHLFWDSLPTLGGSQTADSFYTTSIAAPVKLDQALLGKSNGQVKKYTWRMITNYNFTNGMFKNFSIGGSPSWDDRSVIGYLGAAPDADGIVRSLDANKPIYDKARYSLDVWTSYTIRNFYRKASVKFQLNAQNVLENGGLRPVGVNPDGTVYNWRIIDPRKFVLTTTFDF